MEFDRGQPNNLFKIFGIYFSVLTDTMYLQELVEFNLLIWWNKPSRAPETFPLFMIVYRRIPPYIIRVSEMLQLSGCASWRCRLIEFVKRSHRMVRLGRAMLESMTLHIVSLCVTHMYLLFKKHEAFLSASDVDSTSLAIPYNNYVLKNQMPC